MRLCAYGNMVINKMVNTKIVIALVAIAVLTLAVVGLAGTVYLVSAILLGIWLLYGAWRVWKQGGNKIAWKMYRWSSMYLAFLFAALMVDALM